jgi:hypothetical protein
VKRLNGMDAMLLYSETPNLHTHTLKVAIIHAADYEGGFTFDDLRRTVERRLHLLDPLRYRLIDIPWRLHHPMWLENFDEPLERVRLTALATTRAKELHDLIGPKLQGQMMEYLPPPLAPALFRWQSERAAHNKVMNVAVSNVPGPREHGHVGGALQPQPRRVPQRRC